MRLIRDVPDKSLAMIRGVIRAAEERLVAPATGRDCVCWQLDIDAGYGFHLLSSWRSTDFLVVDVSGRALVHGGDAMIAISSRQTLYVGDAFELPVPLRVAEILAANDLPQRPWLRLREHALVEGAEISVEGHAHWEADPDPGATGYRDTAMRLVLASSAEAPLVVRR
jgi:hypothetical protein